MKCITYRNIFIVLQSEVIHTDTSIYSSKRFYTTCTSYFPKILQTARKIYYDWWSKFWYSLHHFTFLTSTIEGLSRYGCKSFCKSYNFWHFFLFSVCYENSHNDSKDIIRTYNYCYFAIWAQTCVFEQKYFLLSKPGLCYKQKHRNRYIKYYPKICPWSHYFATFYRYLKFQKQRNKSEWCKTFSRSIYTTAKFNPICDIAINHLLEIKTFIFCWIYM